MCTGGLVQAAASSAQNGESSDMGHSRRSGSTCLFKTRTIGYDNFCFINNIHHYVPIACFKDGPRCLL